MPLIGKELPGRERQDNNAPECKADELRDGVWANLKAETTITPLTGVSCPNRYLAKEWSDELHAMVRC
ncbi:hypothetical protein KN1_23460 [Stygiolobus caldivivus]|uniref:Uncharacterized protein n=1 Tax=Stygiolobus caldivivus TaxID=2824673 RepID=A0A8D5U999_9CREN|nr:hypothetical protein KN1_23460 [Stygiolobus caldivivus]